MNFDYDAYKRLLKELKTSGYIFADYMDYKKYDKSVILRHDIDTSLKSAIRNAEIENDFWERATKQYTLC